MKSILFLISISVTTLVLAGPGHGHSHDHSAPAIKMSKTQEIGKSHVIRLVKAGKIDKSWTKATYLKSEMKSFMDQKEWIVSYKNDSGVKGMILYIFLKSSGEFVAANFTGK